MLISEIASKHDFKILALETDKDHCHLFLNAIPTYSPSDIMAKIKGGTSRILREEFEELNAMPKVILYQQQEMFLAKQSSSM